MANDDDDGKTILKKLLMLFTVVCVADSSTPVAPDNLRVIDRKFVLCEF